MYGYAGGRVRKPKVRLEDREKRKDLIWRLSERLQERVFTLGRFQQAGSMRSDFI